MMIGTETDLTFHIIIIIIIKMIKLFDDTNSSKILAI